MMFTSPYREPILPMVSSYGPWGVKYSSADCFDSAAPASITWTANLAQYYPVLVPTTCVAKQVWWANGATMVATGNVECGIYRDAGFKPGAKLVSGSALQGAVNQVQFVDITDTVLTPGLYWMALVMTSGTMTGRSSSIDSTIDAARKFQESSAYPLPSTATPVEATSGAIFLFGFATFSFPSLPSFTNESETMTNSSVSTLSTTLSFTPTSGRLLYSAVSMDKTSGALTGPGGGGSPSGFTLLNVHSSTSVSYAAAYKISSGGETAVQWDWTTAAPGGASMWVGEVSGIDNTTPLLTSAETETNETAVTSVSSGTTSVTTYPYGFAIANAAIDSAGNWRAATRTWSNGFDERIADDGTSSGPAGTSIGMKALNTLQAVETTLSYTGGTSDQMSASVAVFKAT